MHKKILFFGPVQLNNPKAVGGGESGNRKTIKILQNLGFSLTILEKPYITNGFVAYVITLFLNLLKIFLFSLKGYRRIHITGYYLNSIYFEFLTIFIAQIFRYTIVYEIRAGGMIEGFKKRSKIYRYFFKLTLKKSDFILCQGYEYVTFNKEVLGIESLYYPNFILDNFIKPLDNTWREKQNIPNLIYFGRVNEDKNSSFLLDIALELKKMNFNFKLEIVGKCTKEYEEYLKEKIKKGSLGNFVTLNPPLNFLELSKKLKTKHFFVFPSKEKREGHSNALTEAMVFGVVPIVSNQGFNRTVINEDYLISNEFNEENYANKIVKVWENNWVALSQNVHIRVKNNYKESNAVELLEKIYK